MEETARFERWAAGWDWVYDNGGRYDEKYWDEYRSLRYSFQDAQFILLSGIPRRRR